MVGLTYVLSYIYLSIKFEQAAFFSRFFSVHWELGKLLQQQENEYYQNNFNGSIIAGMIIRYAFQMIQYTKYYQCWYVTARTFQTDSTHENIKM